MSSIDELFDVLVKRNDSIADKHKNQRSLTQIFNESVNSTIRGLRDNKLEGDFHELSIIEFIIRGSEEGYSEENLQNYLKNLRESVS